MATDISEMKLEDTILQYLHEQQGYEIATSNEYNKNYAFDTERIKRFILETQKEKVEATRCFATPTEERKFFTRLAKKIQENGISYVLRKGYKYLDIFDLYYPLPSKLNPTAQKLYSKNIFAVTKELKYSNQNDNRIDLMVSLNGLPIITMELKNHYTGQTVENAVRQYQIDRDPKGEPLLQKGVCAVHFAVDDDEIKMCTELKGKASWFLPFNKGLNGGAGNPIRPNGVRTAYLWEEILEKHSLSDILENYAQIIKKTVWEKNKKTGKKEEKTKETVIWPRYHQLDAVRKMLASTAKDGIGQRFLIQHSAGSGKSNSITWLAYQLVTLLDGTTPLIDSVIVVTDRVNLDNQIRDNINAFKHLSNLVDWADSSATLKDSLQSGKKIIITTVHKFPFILDTIGKDLKNKKFAIIIDEAHSSQTGSMSAKMNIALSGNVSSDEEDIEDKLNDIIEGRKMVKNANYYAFTATPKNKTLQMFGTPVPGADGETSYVPFHEYSMKQAIEEGFIMDVLKNYTTYSSFYKVKKAIEGDPVFDIKQANKKIRAYVEARPETIYQKAAIIVNHFQTMVIEKGKMGGQARAMVVTSSIIRAIDFYYEINRLLEERNSPYRALVAFSGSKEYKGIQVTESDINKFPSKDIEERFEEEPYRILVVADKFQTGYDQPLLHSMYVDKVLTDVKAVQTLSRLNRCHPLKRDTFVLDFANDEETIKASFQKYYKTTILSKETDPNKLNDLIDSIEEVNIYTEGELNEIVEKFISNVDRSLLDPIINKAVDRFKDLEEKLQIKTKSSIKNFVRVYPFIASVSSYCSVDWEKHYTYYLLLLHKLPKLKDEDFTEGLIEAIDLDQVQVTKGIETKIELENKNSEIDPIPVEDSKGGKHEPELVKLSDILDEFNEIHWQNVEKAKQQLEELPDKLANDQSFINAAKNSNKETAKQQCITSMITIVAQMLNENTEFCRQYLDNPTFMNFINERVFDKVYNRVINKK